MLGVGKAIDMSLDDFKNWVTIIGTFFAVLVALKGILEYSHQNAMRRLELFQAMRRRYDESPAMNRVRAALEAEEESVLASVPKADKVEFAAFYEDLALMVDTGMMRPLIAQYWFGYYVALADGEQSFWSDMNPDLVYWKVFRRFAKKMRQGEKDLPIQIQRTLRL